MTDRPSPKLAQSQADPRRIVNSLNRMAEGRGDNSDTLTLTAGAASTTIAQPFVSEFSTILLFPRTANAAAELGAGTVYVSAKANGSFTLAHANNAQADRTFDYAWIG